MEVKMKPIPVGMVPGVSKERPHDEWARAAIEAFLESGEDAVELEVPEFSVQYQTIACLLRQYGNKHGVKVKSAKADTPPTHFRTFLYKEAR